MKKSIGITIIFLALSILFTGCYNAVSLEKYYYAIALGIDTSESAELKLIIQVASSKSSSESSSSQSTTNEIFSVDCDSINMGINIINNYLSKKINLSHCSAIIFSEEIAKKGIKTYINTLSNNTEIRPDSHILICNSKVIDVLENVSKSGEQFSSRYYDFVINSVESTGYASKSEFDTFFFAINSDFEIPIANYITIDNEAVQSTGIAIFKDDKFETQLDSLNSLAHLIISNRLKESIITIPNPLEENSKIDISIKKGKSKISNNVHLINNTLLITSDITISGKIINMPYGITTNNIEMVENSLNDYLKKLIENYYYLIIKEYNLDIEDFSDLLASKYLTTADFNRLKFNEIYPLSHYKVSVKSNLSTSLYAKE